mmetsp:Transcript_18271/g.38169  ORF Transcript_18271/g.38169 Transcript_18271/m.38169 type:complete len:87 (+) Transcript_18271:3871-4131(+)
MTHKGQPLREHVARLQSFDLTGIDLVHPQGWAGGGHGVTTLSTATFIAEPPETNTRIDENERYPLTWSYDGNVVRERKGREGVVVG